MKSYNYDLAPGPTANTTAATGGTTSPASSTGELHEPAVMEPALDVPLPTGPAVRVFVLILKLNPQLTKLRQHPCFAGWEALNSRHNTGYARWVQDSMW